MAIALTKTDIFQYFEKSGARMEDRIKALVTNSNASIILNEASKSAAAGGPFWIIG